MTRQIYLIGNMDGGGKAVANIAVIRWDLGWFTDRIAAAKMARDHGYNVIPMRKNPTQL